MNIDPAADGSLQGKMSGGEYTVYDECASFYCDIWRNESPKEVVGKALENIEFWHAILNPIPLLPRRSMSH